MSCLNDGYTESPQRGVSFSSSLLQVDKAGAVLYNSGAQNLERLMVAAGSSFLVVRGTVATGRRLRNENDLKRRRKVAEKAGEGVVCCALRPVLGRVL